MHICQVEKAGISIATADSAYVYLCVDNEMNFGRDSCQQTQSYLD